MRRRTAIRANRRTRSCCSSSVGLGSALFFSALFDATFHWIESGEFEFGSITFIGGLIGGVAMFTLLMWFGYRSEWKNIGKLLNTITVGILIAHGFGRLGCLCAGCCYGIPSELFGFVFPSGHSAGTGPVLPTQLYESAFLFLTAYAIHTYKTFHNREFASYSDRLRRFPFSPGIPQGGRSRRHRRPLYASRQRLSVALPVPVARDGRDRRLSARPQGEGRSDRRAEGSRRMIREALFHHANSEWGYVADAKSLTILFRAAKNDDLAIDLIEYNRFQDYRLRRAHSMEKADRTRCSPITKPISFPPTTAASTISASSKITPSGITANTACSARNRSAWALSRCRGSRTATASKPRPGCGTRSSIRSSPIDSAASDRPIRRSSRGETNPPGIMCSAGTSKASRARFRISSNSA
ncbi:MAG: alpha amylase N-terminal ig-like domain-containing protein [Bacillus subtilis]|nr:alpha amylase N-terminal ig-like domain-containing protein [Bacillus subtilis]